MSRRRRHTGRDSEPRTDAAYRTLAVGIRRLAAGLAADDALDAELVASDVLSMFTPELADRREAADRLAARVLREVASRPDPDTFALVLAVEALATPAVRAVATELAAAMRADGIPEPRWGRIIGRPALVDAWVSTDELDDQSNLAMVFAYERTPPHVIVAMTDANFAGLVRKVIVADDPDLIRREWREVSGLPVLPISEQALADRLSQGIRAFDEFLDPPVDDEARSRMPLLRARLALLPSPRPIVVPEVSEDERAQVLQAFVASPEAAGLPATGNGPASDLASWFIDFACDEGAGDPLRWSPIAVELLLADWLPRKAIIDPDEARVLPDVLRAFVRYAAGRKGLAPGIYAETLEAVDEFQEEFLEAVGDEGRAGPGKQLALQLLAAGVDLADAEAVDAWIDRHNRGLDGA